MATSIKVNEIFVGAPSGGDEGWILTTGIWNDAEFWDDSAFWNDGI